MNSILVLNPSSWVATTFNSLFASSGILAGALQLWCVGISAVAGVILLVHLSHHIYTAANTGKVHKTTGWYGFRAALAVALVAPSPTQDGLNMSMEFVVGAAKMGSALADGIWGQVTQDVLAGKTLVLPATPSVAPVVAGLWTMGACAAVQNRTHADAGSAAISFSKSISAAGTTTYSADGDPAVGGVPGQCGSVTFQTGTAGSVQAVVAQAAIDAVASLSQTMTADANAFAGATLPPYSGQTVSLTADAAGWVQTLQTALQQAAQQALTADPTQQADYQSWASSATQLGWPGAGAWALQIGYRSGQVLSAADAVMPTITGPKIEWWSDDVYVGEKSAIVGADQAIRSALQIPNTNQQAAAVQAGQADSIFSFMDLARWQGFYNGLATGAGTGINPVAEIISTGHSLLSIGGATMTAYLTAVGAASASAKLADVPVVGLVASGLSGIKGVMDVLSPGVWLVVGAIEVAGGTMAYVLPIIPFIYMLFLTLDWLRRVVLAVILAPVWGMQHLSLEEGEGLGSKASQGWLSLVDIFVRPSVAVMSLVVGFQLFFAIAGLFRQLFYAAVRETLQGHMGGLSGLVTYSILACTILTGLMVASFVIVHKGGDWVAEKLGVAGAGGQTETKHSDVVVATGGSGQRQMSGAAGQVMSRPGRRGGSARGAGGGGEDGGAIRQSAKAEAQHLAEE